MEIKIFADGADSATMIELYKNPIISGLTTNPTLMRKAGIVNYRAFARDILKIVKEKPISFEVFSDDMEEMQRQAMEIASWGDNVYVKIPITNTQKRTTYPVIQYLTNEGVKVNVTAITTLGQVIVISKALNGTKGAYVSVFAGRIADTGINPVPIMKDALYVLRSSPNVELIWASPREVYNVIQADKIGCHIITCTNDIIKKLSLIGKDLTEYSLETVQMFYQDAKESGYEL